MKMAFILVMLQISYIVKKWAYTDFVVIAAYLDSIMTNCFSFDYEESPNVLLIVIVQVFHFLCLSEIKRECSP